MGRKEYRALTGLNFVPDGEDEEVRVEAGDKFSGMKETSVKHELAARNIEPWTEEVEAKEEGGG